MRSSAIQELNWVREEMQSELRENWGKDARRQKLELGVS